MDSLEAIVAAVAARAEEAAARLERLARRLDADESAPPEPLDPVRLAAIELAVSGCDRAQTAARLHECFPDADLTAVLSDVFG